MSSVEYRRDHRVKKTHGTKRLDDEGTVHDAAKAAEKMERMAADLALLMPARRQRRSGKQKKGMPLGDDALEVMSTVGSVASMSTCCDLMERSPARTASTASCSTLHGSGSLMSLFTTCEANPVHQELESGVEVATREAEPACPAGGQTPQPVATFGSVEHSSDAGLSVGQPSATRSSARVSKGCEPTKRPSFSMDAAEQAVRDMASMRAERKRDSLIMELAERDVKIASLERKLRALNELSEVEADSVDKTNLAPKACETGSIEQLMPASKAKPNKLLKRGKVEADKTRVQADRPSVLHQQAAQGTSKSISSEAPEAQQNAEEMENTVLLVPPPVSCHVAEASHSSVLPAYQKEGSSRSVSHVPVDQRHGLSQQRHDRNVGAAREIPSTRPERRLPAFVAQDGMQPRRNQIPVQVEVLSAKPQQRRPILVQHPPHYIHLSARRCASSPPGATWGGPSWEQVHHLPLQPPAGVRMWAADVQAPRIEQPRELPMPPTASRRRAWKADLLQPIGQRLLGIWRF
mmetsp:Transcript_64079/g.119111  ORF Transcript_64079/g.119111 Transcript_64079/m.119111 type:complete len:521 (-) Transcript_64079:123-1685(-)